MAEKVKIVKLVDREHDLYKDNYLNWELYRDAAKGSEEFMVANLKSHRLEDSTDFGQRQDRLYYLNFCDTIPKIFNSYIFRHRIERTADSDLELFRKSIDGKNTAVGNFIKRCGYLASVYGVIHVIVDITESSKQNPTKADVKSEGTQPFTKIVLPTQLKDWSVDDKGNYNWILIEFDYNDDSDPTIERTTSTYYKLISREAWWIEDEDGEKVPSFPDGTPASGTNALGIVPIATMYHTEIDDDKIGESILKDIVFINITIMNWCSCIDEMIERQTFSQLVMPDDGSLSESEEDGQDPLNVVSTSTVMTFPADASNPPAFISPNTDSITTIWNLTLDHVKEIYRLAGLQGGTSDLYTSRSGRQSQMSFLGVNSTLKEKAASYEKFENDVSRLAYLQLGKTIDDYTDVVYPNSFDIVALEEELDSIIKIMEKNFSTVLNKELQKNVARKSITLPNNLMVEIEAEIDASDGKVEAAKTGLPDSELNGQGNPNSNQTDSLKSSGTQKKEDTSHRKKD